MSDRAAPSGPGGPGWPPAAETIPTEPGVYRFFDTQGQVLYVGKANNLRTRLRSYFVDPARLNPRIAQMRRDAVRVEWTTVRTGAEALQLEYTWIKQFTPRYNIQFRDDKSYPWLAVSWYEPVPRLQIVRGAKREGMRYFGPYSHVQAIRDTLDVLLHVFPARSCSAGVYRRAERIGRPCLLGYIGKCRAPCVGWISLEDHRQLVEQFCRFMAGRPDAMIHTLEQQMARASAAEQFELAARLRDNLRALRQVNEKQTVVLGPAVNVDVVGLAQTESEAAVYVFHVRGGRVRGQRGWIVDTPAGATSGQLISTFVSSLYAVADDGPGSGIPPQIVVPVRPEDAAVIEDGLAGRRGARTSLQVPLRSAKRSLLDLADRNAAQVLARHDRQRQADLGERSKALLELQSALDLPAAPARIEGFDVSHLQSGDVVASMVVFDGGRPRRDGYRHFALHSGTSDTDWVAETVRRRFLRYLDQQLRDGADPGTPPGGPDGDEDEADRAPRAGGFGTLPALVVVDGGPLQAAAAQGVLDELGIEGIAVIGLAKRLEEIWRPGRPDPVILPRSDAALYLVQHVRDEAHRFAIGYHRRRRSKSMTASVLDGIAGLGPARRAALLDRFGSVRRLRAATADQIAQVPGIGPATASNVVEALARADGA